MKINSKTFFSPLHKLIAQKKSKTKLTYTKQLLYLILVMFITLLLVKSPSMPLRFLTLPPVIVPRIVFFSDMGGCTLMCGGREDMDPLAE
jgi:hypothetical protein